MSTTNFAVMACVGGNAQPQVLADNQSAGPAAAQSTAVRLPGNLNRCTKAASTGSFILPSILNGEANDVVWLVNDTAVTVNVYPASGEKTNGGLNTAFQITTGLSGVFFPVLNSVNNYPSTLDWRCALIP